MGMPISVEIIDSNATESIFNKVFDYFTHVDEKFSTYKKTSEITAINEGRLKEDEWSGEMHLMFALCEETKKETGGYFDIKKPDGTLDPSGLVKGWSIWQASQIIQKDGFKNFYVDAGGDIQAGGKNADGDPWTVGIKNPWDQTQNVKIVNVTTQGVATSGTYIRGLHIYNPRNGNKPANDITSLTVIGPNIYEADRFATAAFAMGVHGTHFIERLPGFEAYAIDNNKMATMTSGFATYLSPDDNHK